MKPGDFGRGIDLVLRLTAHDLRNRCLGSTLGFAWAFIQPFVMTIILYLVVGVAFKAKPVEGMPFIVWLLAGMSAWSFFSDAWNQATNVFCEYAFLVRKVNFRLFNLPLVKILAALAVQFVFLLIVAAVLTPPDVVSQVLLAAPMLALYELGIIFTRIGYKHKTP